MLNLIQAGTTPATWISPFFFDLVIADESHRSIYNIYQQVVRYFHAITLGLTATPRDHVDHDTFALFDCADARPDLRLLLRGGRFATTRRTSATSRC